MNAKYLTKMFDRSGSCIKQKYANSLSDALAIQRRFEQRLEARRVEIFERHYDENDFISYRPRVQVL